MQTFDSAAANSSTVMLVRQAAGHMLSFAH